MNSESRYAIVVDSQGYKVEFVLVETVATAVLDNDGNPTGAVETKEIPYGYTMSGGESLVYEDTQTALTMIRPLWTGANWEETAAPEDIEATLPPLEDVRAAKLSELSAACESAIYEGVDVQTQYGMQHYSLTINDQTNIANLAVQSQAGTTVLYHADGELCRPFAPDEMLALAAAAVTHKTYHTTYCNHLNVWARRAETREEPESIMYGCDLPDDLASSMAALLGNAA